MKKLLFLLTFVVITIFNLYSQQSSDIATLTIRGNVPVIVNVDMTPSPEATNLVMNSPGVYSFDVGVLQYRSNADFNVSVSPSNGTSFVMTDASGNQIPYRFLVNGTEYQPGDNILSQGRTFGNEQLTVTIEYTITDPLPVPGDYEDILSFNISGQ